MKRVLAGAILLLSPVASAQEVMEPPLEPPPEGSGPKKAGIVLELDLGIGACPDCPDDDAGLVIGGRVGYRLPTGFALGIYTVILTATDDSSCGYYYYYDDCYGDEITIFFLGGEARYHPLSQASTTFDPFVALGVGYGIGASRAGMPDLAEYSGFVLLPRFGAMAILSDVLAIGGSVGRTFAFWDTECVEGEDGGGGYYDYFTCGEMDEEPAMENPQVWFTAFEATFRF